MADLTLREQWRLAVRSLLIQLLLNYRTMQGGGYLFALRPWLKDPATRRARVEAASGFLNGHPILSAFALGAMLRRLQNGDADASLENLHRWRESLSAPLGLIGDSLIWDRWKPLVFAAGCLLLLILPKESSPVSHIAVAVLCLAVYNIPLFRLRLWGIKQGDRLGERVLELSNHPGIKLWRKWLTAAGGILCGGLTAVALLRGSEGRPLAALQFLAAFGIVITAEKLNVNVVWSALLALTVAVGIGFAF